MKSPVKVLLGTISILIGAALVSWTATFLYWHNRITRAIRILGAPESAAEADALKLRQEAAESLVESGCRSLPYLVRSMDSKKSTEYLSFITFLFCSKTEPPQIPLAEVDRIDPLKRTDQWEINVGDPPELCSWRIELIRSWWKEHGSEYHQWWRVWTGECHR